MIKMIVAMTQDNVIGQDNKLPWHIKEELKHFKQTTLNHAVMFGRKTLEGMRLKLENRYVYCLTSNKAYSSPWCDEVINSVDAVFQKFKDSEQTLFIAGGKKVYEQFYHHADEIILTTVKQTITNGVKLNLDLTQYKKQEIKSTSEFVVNRYIKRES